MWGHRPPVQAGLRAASIALGALGVLGALLLAQGASADSDPAPGASPLPFGGESMFRKAGATRAKVQRMLSAPPQRCTSSSPGSWLCTWRVDPNDPGYSTLAAGASIGRPVHLLCSFPELRSDAPGHCTSHSAVPLRQPPPDSKTEAAVQEQSWRDQVSLARRSLAGARTLESIARLLGAGPDDCLQRDDESWVCHWLADLYHPGYSTLGLLIDHSGPAELICLLPLDGGERGDDSCRVVRTDRPPSS